MPASVSSSATTYRPAAVVPVTSLSHPIAKGAPARETANRVKPTGAKAQIRTPLKIVAANILALIARDYASDRQRADFIVVVQNRDDATIPA